MPLQINPFRSVRNGRVCGIMKGGRITIKVMPPFLIAGRSRPTEHVGAAGLTPRLPRNGNTRRMAETSQPHRPKIIVVMPAYNAARTLERTYRDIPTGTVDHVILVDDVSQDATVTISRQLGLNTILHIQNRGYGGNQKTCYFEALTEGADVVVMLHPDHQYDATKIPELIAPILDGSADMVLGS